MRHFNVGIIGCGVIAPSHIESYQRLDGVRVKWVCDLVEERARKRGEEFGVGLRTTRAEEVYGDTEVDAVSICTDHASHAPLAVAALAAGKHVLCEKALGASVADLDAMEAAARAHPDLVFAGVFQHRFDAVYQYVKEQLEQGVLGTMLTASLQMSCYRSDEYYRADAWRGTWEHEGGSVLSNQAIHSIDILDWITGGISDVRGVWTNRTHQGVIETDDTAVAAVRFASGALGTIEATSSSRILEWEARLSLRGAQGIIELLNTQVQRVEHTDQATAERLRAALAQCKDERRISSAKSYYGEGHPANIADFVAAIREHRPPFVPIQSARRAVDIVQRIYGRTSR